MEELYKLLEESLNERLYQLSVGGPRNKDGDIRLKLRPVMIKTEIYFQLEMCIRDRIWPAALHVYFDLFSGAIQTYVFCMLTMTYISDAIGDK